MCQGLASRPEKFVNPKPEALDPKLRERTCGVLFFAVVLVCRLEKVGYVISEDTERGVEGEGRGGNVFQIKWALAHADIDFKALLPNQITNHYPNTAAELGRNKNKIKGAVNKNKKALLPQQILYCHLHRQAYSGTLSQIPATKKSKAASQPTQP